MARRNMFTEMAEQQDMIAPSFLEAGYEPAGMREEPEPKAERPTQPEPERVEVGDSPSPRPGRRKRDARFSGYFHQEDLDRWKARAEEGGISLNNLVEKVMNEFVSSGQTIPF